jgi:hypothetical protein
VAGAGGACAAHPDRAASFVCARCGDNGCTDCERRAVPEAKPICPGCWARREERVAKAKPETSHLVGAAIAVGLLALVPCAWPAQLGAIVLGLVVHKRAAQTPRHQTLGLVAAGLGALGVVVSLVFLTLWLGSLG